MNEDNGDDDIGDDSSVFGEDLVNMSVIDHMMDDGKSLGVHFG